MSSSEYPDEATPSCQTNHKGNVVEEWSHFKSGGTNINELLGTVNALMLDTGGRGLLEKFITGQHYSLKSDNHDYGISWYLNRIDDYLTLFICIQLPGLAVQFVSCLRSDNRMFTITSLHYASD
jgi:hypothetical protein